MRVVLEIEKDYPTQFAAMKTVARKLGIGSPETVRKWIRKAEADRGERAGTSSEDHAEIKRLRRDSAELRRGQ